MPEEDAQNGTSRRPHSSDELLQRIEEAWAHVLATIDGVQEAVLVKPGITGWSVKDNLAHISAWEQFLIRHYLGGEPAHAVWGLDAATWQDLDEDGLNKIIFERNQARPVAEVVDVLHRTHANLVATLKRTPFEDLMALRTTEDGLTQPLLGWVEGNTYDHYRHHQADIEGLLLPTVLGD